MGNYGQNRIPGSKYMYTGLMTLVQSRKSSAVPGKATSGITSWRHIFIYFTLKLLVELYKSVLAYVGHISINLQTETTGGSHDHWKPLPNHPDPCMQYSLFGNAGTNAFEIKNVHVVQWEAAITGGDHLQKPKTRSTQVGSMIPFGLPRAEWLHRGQSQLVRW